MIAVAPSSASWIRRNLFARWYDGVLTVVSGLLLSYLAFRLLRFAFVTARWEVIRRNLKQLLVDVFPAPDLWRVWTALFILSASISLFVGAFGRRTVESGELQPHPTSLLLLARRTWPALLLLVTLFALRPDPKSIALALALAATAIGTRRVGATLRVGVRTAALTGLLGVAVAFVVLIAFGGVGWDRWGGLMLTMFLAVTGILASFPIGVLLALGRRSSLPVVRAFCVGYIELIRGVPLLALLFMGSFVVGFLYPVSATKPSLVTRALIALVAFTSAYVAEIVRGGLQSVPIGQIEAAHAVGLSHLATARFVVLPQALRAVIPALVGQFISLFKDTSLVAIIGLTELLKAAQILTSQRDFVGQQLQAETLVFAAFVYWVGSYTMSRESQRLERRLAGAR